MVDILFPPLRAYRPWAVSIPDGKEKKGEKSALLFCWWCFTPRLSWLCTGGARGVFRDSRGFIHPLAYRFPVAWLTLRGVFLSFFLLKKRKNIDEWSGELPTCRCPRLPWDLARAPLRRPLGKTVPFPRLDSGILLTTLLYGNSLSICIIKKAHTHTPLGIYMYTISLSLFLPTIKKVKRVLGCVPTSRRAIPPTSPLSTLPTCWFDNIRLYTKCHISPRVSVLIPVIWCNGELIYRANVFVCLCAPS